MTAMILSNFLAVVKPENLGLILILPFGLETSESGVWFKMLSRNDLPVRSMGTLIRAE